ncbi:IS110 family transposase [Ktedonobacter robiniae]|uniref:IS110 family transposase n=1 Tax=Ktedonobacter robiniae TaxID=2778365 RepID=A0ABQ3V6F5_9CHLR|nr:IS110 family transposase [Ktedonobacter robiniae]GHO60332.1 IS110 family transposase [Ktedonobacter robiniae]
MQIVYERCCGLDIHQKTVVGCRLLSQPKGNIEKSIRTFATTISGLMELDSWLAEGQVEQVALESTGIYWRPIFQLLEGRYEIILVNAQHMHAIPGHKTDIKDSEWIADLLRHGLLKASFIPPKPIRELRDLVRTQTHLMQERNRHINRIHKILETANIKLSSVVTDIVGKSARQMLEALIAGESDPAQLAKLARGRMRPKVAQLQQALQGHLEPHHRFLLRETLAHLDFLQQRTEQLEQEVAERLSPFEASIVLLTTIPGLSRRSATILISELGTDLAAFPSAAHLASWVGLCPGSQLSAGKRRNGKPTKGNSYLRSVLVQVAWVLTRMSDNYLSAQFHHLKPRLGAKKAVVAVAHSVLVIVYHVLTKGEPYQDLGPDYFRGQNKEQQARRFVHQLETLGYHVELAPQEEVTS